ncbi:Hypothetical_protein [Hexamita inflata]|uniref:Hypothetical_protein n=1 Tax=Hexamita inflata TaxID=28002 RepID=A0AA86RVZ2_9EUKA|nr:Hypothetical protein HINF_LOCUS66549 [Hexamita inflata]
MQRCEISTSPRQKIRKFRSAASDCISEVDFAGYQFWCSGTKAASFAGNYFLLCVWDTFLLTQEYTFFVRYKTIERKQIQQCFQIQIQQVVQVTLQLQTLQIKIVTQVLKIQCNTQETYKYVSVNVLTGLVEQCLVELCPQKCMLLLVFAYLGNFFIRDILVQRLDQLFYLVVSLHHRLYQLVPSANNMLLLSAIYLLFRLKLFQYFCKIIAPQQWSKIVKNNYQPMKKQYKKSSFIMKNWRQKHCSLLLLQKLLTLMRIGVITTKLILLSPRGSKRLLKNKNAQKTIVQDALELNALREQHTISTIYIYHTQRGLIVFQHAIGLFLWRLSFHWSGSFQILNH